MNSSPHIMSPVASQIANNFPFRQAPPTSSITSHKFRSPMSSLGRWMGGVPPSEINFPDPDSLQSLPHLPGNINDMFSKVLADRSWYGQFDSIQKQVLPALHTCIHWLYNSLFG